MTIQRCIAMATVFTAAVLVAVTQGQNDNCLGCLCEASTNCNATIGCTTPYPGGYFCGAFAMTKNYWIDSGKAVLGGDNPDRDGAFETCANDIICAADSVINYMKKFGEDCNEDGQITCADYAFIHVLGGYGCQDRSFVTTEFYGRFSKCSNVLSAATLF